MIGIVLASTRTMLCPPTTRPFDKLRAPSKVEGLALAVTAPAKRDGTGAGSSCERQRAEMENELSRTDATTDLGGSFP